ncbi:MAG: hypothetical protein Fur003_0480 [Candidatus Dojkabacteria bacterium]
MLQKRFRLRQKNDYELIYRKGRRIRGRYGMLLALNDWKHTNDDPLFGFIVGKKLGNAVKRHKFQRWMREIVRAYLKSASPATLSKLKNMKFSFIAYEYPESFELLNKEVNELLKRI